MSCEPHYFGLDIMTLALSHEDGTELSLLLAQLMRRYRHILIKILRQENLPPHALSILSALKDGSLRQSQLSTQLEIKPANLSRQISYLHEKGLLTATYDEADRRAFDLNITEAGKDALTSFNTLLVAELTDHLQDWSGEELSIFLGMLSRLYTDLGPQSRWTGNV